MSLAVVIIASEKRRESTFPRCLESVRAQTPDELVVVADFPVEAKGVRSLVVEPMLRNTIDALVKRDVGLAGTVADNICFLCDDHVLGPDFVFAFRSLYESRGWDMLCPARYCTRDGGRIWLNNGHGEGYIGGHAGVYRRAIFRKLPWSAGPHHPNWDLLWTHRQVGMGSHLTYADERLAVEDIEGGTPWL
jgi:glycosyltransferase involved in cell wall biosynthesis